MQLCSVGIFAQRQVISLNSKQLLSLSFKEHDVYLELPAEVLDYSNPSLEVAFAPFGPVGPHFKFPNGMIPVSPAVWLYFSPQKEFRDPATLKLPHCFESKTPDILEYLCFLKADEEDINRDESGQVSINFKKIDKSTSDFPMGCQYGTLKDHHFCIYCLAAYPVQDDVIGKVNYCLTILKPRFYPTEEYGMKVYSVLHFNLESCKRICPYGIVLFCIHINYHSLFKNRNQMITYHLKSFYNLKQNGTKQHALGIDIDKRSATACGWMITLESEEKVL